MDDYSDLCSRCKSKSVESTCLNCETFKDFCQKCDNFVHSLPSKKNHQRNLVIMNKSISSNSKLQSPCRNINNEISYQNPGLSNSNVINNQSSISDFKKYQSNNYSSTYINEIKSVYELEKQDLLFKIQNLETHLDRIKSTYSDQINNLQSEILDLKREHQLELINIEKNNELKIIGIIKEKDSEIKDLLYKIKDLQSSHEEVYQENEKTFENLKNYEEKIGNLSQEIQKKENDFDEMRNHYESKLENFARKYDQNIKSIQETHTIDIKEFQFRLDALNERYNDALNEKALIVKDFENKIKNIEKYYNDILTDLKNENRGLHKKIGDFDILEKETIQIKGMVEKYKNDNKFQYSQIKFLENENKLLKLKNEEITHELARIDKILYPNKKFQRNS